MFAVVVVVSLWFSVCLADIKQHQLKTYSIKISEADFCFYFTKSFSTRNILHCTLECTKTESSTTLFSEDTRICSCRGYADPVEADDGKSIQVMQGDLKES